MLTADGAVATQYLERTKDIGGPADAFDPSELQSFSRDVRLSILDMIEAAGQGHIGGDLSVTDILVTLYGAVLNVDPRRGRLA